MRLLWPKAIYSLAIVPDASVCFSLLAGISHQADIVIYSDGISLRAMASGIIAGVTRFGVATLRSGAVNINPCAIHIAHRPPKGDIRSVVAGRSSPIEVGGAAPVPGIVGLVCFIGDGGGAEQGVDGGGTGRVGRTGIVYKALQFLALGILQSL